jgi:Flp pilus assembly protein TadG
VLIALVLFVLIGGAIVTFNFMRQARAAARQTRRK